MQYNKFVSFIKILSQNWQKTIPELLEDLYEYEINIDEFFILERNVAFKLSSLLSDVNVLQKEILQKGDDVSPFVSKLSHVFLPSTVYQLEEYGLPRMISKKIHNSYIIDLLSREVTIHDVINKFYQIGKEKMLSYDCFDEFDDYILEYFYDGITLDREDMKLHLVKA